MANKSKRIQSENYAISLLKCLDENDLIRATDYMKQLLAEDDEVKSSPVIESGVITELSETFERCETLIENLNTYALGSSPATGTVTFADRAVCSTVWMLLDYAQDLRMQLDELLARI